MSIQLISNRPEARRSQAGSILIVHYFGAPTVAAINDDFNASRQIVERFGEASFLVVFEAHLVGRPRPGVVTTVDERLDAMAEKIRCSAIVVRGTGIAPTLMRTVLSGAAFLSRQQERRKVFRAVGEALTWLQTFEGQHQSVREVRLEEVETVLQQTQPS